jgi:hypothetical protein
MCYVQSLDELRKDLGAKNADLITRDLGRKAFSKLEEKLEALPEPSTLVLDAKGIYLIDSSFFDEAILTLFIKLTEGEYGQRYLLLINSSDDSLFNIESAIKRRNLKGAFPMKKVDGTWHFFGALEPNLKEALDRLVKKGNLTARDLASYFDIGISNASNRLRRLYELHLARRTEENTEAGLSHRYFPID